MKFIAAIDNSGGSTGGVLNRYGLEYSEDDKFDLIHGMRMRMVTSDAFNSDSIWAVILYEDTVQRGMIDVLKEKGIESILKIDKGLEDNGTLKPFVVQEAISMAKGCYGTKMRSVVRSVEMVDEVVGQQFAIASEISASGLVPIIEPEVEIGNPDKGEIEKHLYVALEKYLNLYDGKCILKLTPPEQNNMYFSLTTNDRVEQVVFLSGGYDLKEACNRLSCNDNVSASFSRALCEGLHYTMTDGVFNKHLGSNIDAIRSSC